MDNILREEIVDVERIKNRRSTAAGRGKEQIKMIRYREIFLYLSMLLLCEKL